MKKTWSRNTRILWHLALLSTLGLLVNACAVAKQTLTPMPTNTPQKALGGGLGRGVNLGNALEAPREGEWGLVLQEHYFERIREIGFDAVRIPIRWNAHAAMEPPYTIDPSFFERVDWAIAQALNRDLKVVINIHHYDELMSDPRGQHERFLAIWRQIAEHYRDYDERLYFEILNEPHDQLDAALWNQYLADALAVIRESNPSRWVIIGPAYWNSYQALNALKLPEDDPHLIVTFHYYLPFAFTHQGAEWVENSNRWLGTQWKGSDIEVQEIRSAFDYVAKWAAEHGVPVYLGEFGAYSKADMDSRVRWTTTVAREAEAHGFSWAYWEFGAGFGIYDPSQDAWREPLLRALLPEE